MQIEFLMKKKSFFTGITLIGTSILQTLIFPCRKFRMPDLEKTGNINMPTNILLRK